MCKRAFGGPVHPAQRQDLEPEQTGLGWDGVECPRGLPSGERFTTSRVCGQYLFAFFQEQAQISLETGEENEKKKKKWQETWHTVLGCFFPCDAYWVVVA